MVLTLFAVATITTLSGFGNLIMTRWYMARFGIRFALVMQTFWPCLRNICQIWGIYRSSFFGIAIFQVSWNDSLAWHIADSRYRLLKPSPSWEAVSATSSQPILTSRQ